VYLVLCSCPHCKHFVPAFTEIAAFYKVEGSIHIGAISCMDHVQCRRSGIKGFPTLMALNFNTKKLGENKRSVGTHTVQEVKDYINKLFEEKQINETGTTKPSTSFHQTILSTSTTTSTTRNTSSNNPTKKAKPGEQERQEIWEESTLPMNHTTRLRDAASAFVFGLKQGIFMGREFLEDMELDALKEWLFVVSKTFPGSINRQIIQQLYEQTNTIAFLSFDQWEIILKEWQQKSQLLFEQEQATRQVNDPNHQKLPEWQQISNLFQGFGADYTACALYTCGQWNLFHMMTMNPPSSEKDGQEKRSDELLVRVIAGIRRFMKYFFGCVQCRDHFLEYNTLEMVKKIYNDPNKPRALKRWLWEMHNAVNTRIRHPVWPKPQVCPTCGSTGNWIDVEVDKWLGNTYAFQEIIVPKSTQAPSISISSSPHKGGGLRKNEEDLDQEPIAPLVHIPQSSLEVHHHTTATTTRKKNPIEDGTNRIEGNFHTGNKENNTHAGVSAVPMTLFAWYVLPIAAVGAYLLFVRRKTHAKLHFKRQQRK
jgi:thiol oxidase